MTQVVNGERHVFSAHQRSNKVWGSNSGFALAIVATLIAFAATFGLRRSWPAPVFLVFVLAIGGSTVHVQFPLVSVE